MFLADNYGLIHEALGESNKKFYIKMAGCLLEFCAVYSRRIPPAFQRCFLPPSSGRCCRPWLWRKQAPLKRRYTSTRLSGATSQTTAIFILTAMTASDLTNLTLIHSHLSQISSDLKPSKHESYCSSSSYSVLSSDMSIQISLRYFTSHIFIYHVVIL
jgi:hypothetical protein